MSLYPYFYLFILFIYICLFFLFIFCHEPFLYPSIFLIPIMHTYYLGWELK